MSLVNQIIDDAQNAKSGDCQPWLGMAHEVKRLQEAQNNYSPNRVAGWAWTLIMYGLLQLIGAGGINWLVKIAIFDSMTNTDPYEWMFYVGFIALWQAFIAALSMGYGLFALPVTVIMILFVVI